MVARDLLQQLAGIPVEVLTWRESTPMLVQSVRLEETFNYVMNGVVLAMVGLGIFNTILMSVLERRYEFGVCTALGLRPRQLAEMLIGESLALTAISLAMGLALGLGIHHHFAIAGLDLRWLFTTDLPTAFVFDPIIYPRLSLRRIAWSVGIVFMMSTLMSLYPAIKAARTELPDALKVI
jgi:putative ABC transport system permease protein